MTSKAGLVAAICLCAISLQSLAQENQLAWAAAQAPADACLVATIRSLSELEGALRVLVGPEGEETALVKALEQDLPPGALDVGGPVAVIVPAAEKGWACITLLRIKDAARLQGETVAGNILKIRLREPPPDEPPSEPQPRDIIYVWKCGPWAAVGGDLAAVRSLASARARLALTQAARSAIADHQDWLQADPRLLAAAVRQEIAEQQKDIECRRRGNHILDAKVLQWVAVLLDQAQAISLTADAKPSGITCEIEVALAEGSPLLAVAAAGLPLESFRGRLPAIDRLVLAGWARFDWARAVPAVKALIQPLLVALADGGDDAARRGMAEMLASCEQWATAVGPDFSVLMEAPPGGKGEPRLVEAFTLKDPAAYRQLLARQIAASEDAVWGMIRHLGAMPSMPAVRLDVQRKPDAETIEGLPVDVVTMHLTALAPCDAAPQDRARLQAAVAATFGRDAMDWRIAAVDKVGLAVLGGPKTAARAIRTVRGEAPCLGSNPRVAAAAARLPKGGFVAGLLSLGDHVYMHMCTMERRAAMHVPPEVRKAARALKPLEPPSPADLVTIGMRLDGRRLCLAVDAPQCEIRAAVAAAKQGSDRLMWYTREQAALEEKKAKE
jgi:hypothetical protein